MVGIAEGSPDSITEVPQVVSGGGGLGVSVGQAVAASS